MSSSSRSNSVLLDIDSLNTDGDGVARHHGRTLTIPFTIPGERVRASLSPSRTGSASLVEIVRPSPHRVTARCGHFGVCGGCAWQHIAYPEQLRLKTAIVGRLLREAVANAPAPAPMIAATPLDDPWHFRQKAHFVFSGGPGGLVMGHYVRGSRRVLPVHECPVHDERGNRVAFGLYDAYARKIARQRRGGASGPPGSLKSVAVRASVSTNETMATLVVSDADSRVRTATKQALTEPWAPSSFHLNFHPRGDPFIFGADTQHISGTGRLREDLSDTAFLISPTAFFQTNVRAAAILVRLVLDAIPANASVLDLYAGAGLFALPLAKRGQSVVAIEANAVAVVDGEASMRLNRIPGERCRFMARPVSVAIRRVKTADAVVLDPPREGCEAIVLDEVFGRIRPAVAVYVSCNPETLARDAKRIVKQGYTIGSVQPVDMFPHTPHIETVVVISKAK